MADKSSHFKHKSCSFCDEHMTAAHAILSTRGIDGKWHIVYRFCWSCGYEELRRLRMRPAGKPVEA